MVERLFLLFNVKLEMTSKQQSMKQLTSPVQKSLKPNQTPPYSKRCKHNRRSHFLRRVSFLFSFH